MAFAIRATPEGLAVELSGSVTIGQAQELAAALAAELRSGSAVTLETGELEDADTSILQLLRSLRGTAAAFAVANPSEAFVGAVDRCGMRRELLGAKETP